LFWGFIVGTDILTFIRHRIVAIIAGGLLVSLAAVGAFASQEGPSVNETATATDTATSTATDTPEATETPEATDTPEATETDEADDADGNHEDGLHGIPDDNPSHEPNDDDVCEQGETEIKTTPSGTEVVVPCHAEKEHGPGDADKHDDADDQGEDENDDEQHDAADSEDGDAPEHETDGAEVEDTESDH
jgi:hypothetical protein